MSKSAILSSSIAKKYWMAMTGLFLCLFLVGHLIGNLQLIFKVGEEGRKAFNEYAYFMQHNILIKVMSYVTYISILFHAVDGFLLTVQNKKARPVPYAYNNQGANTSTPARMMAVLGSIILIFIATHMVNFWAKMHFGGLKLHTYELKMDQNVGQNPEKQYIYHTHTITPQPVAVVEQIEVKNEVELYYKGTNLKIGEGYKDLHSAVIAFFTGKDTNGIEGNSLALVAVALYALSMLVLGFHLWHGFSSTFQSLGINHKRYTPGIKIFGKIFSVIVPLAFAIIPIILFLNK
jgi:succinate dehydrogenase / fumarate reductase cytochrome b subunit